MKRFLVILVLAVIVFAGSWELLQPGMLKTHDYVHGARIAELGRGLQNGHFPVRWSQNFGYGYGMPLFEFYAPLPYYVGAFFWLLSIPLVTSVKLLFLICTIGTAWGAYLLGKALYGRLGGLVVATAITLAPYRAVNLFVRGALGEAWGMMAGILVLYGSVLILKRVRHGWWVLLLSLVGLFLSHNLMTLIFVPFALLFVALWLGFNWLGVRLDSERKKIALTFQQRVKADLREFLPKFSSAYTLAAGLAAFYLLPALMEKRFTMVDELILAGYFDYHLHFIYLRQLVTPYWGYGGSVWGPDDGISFFLGWGQLLGLMISSWLVGQQIWLQLQRKDYQRLQLVWKHALWWTGSILLVMSVWFATQKSLVVWESTAALRYVQFPWRFMAVSAVFLGLMIGYGFRLQKNFPVRVLLAGLLIFLMLTNFRYFKAESILQHPEELYYEDEIRIQSQMSGILPDFMPLDFKLIGQPPGQYFTCEPACGFNNDDNFSDQVLINRPHQKLMNLKMEEDGRVKFSVAYFPGWIAEVDGQRVPVIVSEDGLIEVSMPAGEHLVGISFSSTPIRKWADAISIVALMMLIGIYYRSGQRRIES